MKDISILINFQIDKIIQFLITGYILDHIFNSQNIQLKSYNNYFPFKIINYFLNNIQLIHANYYINQLDQQNYIKPTILSNMDQSQQMDISNSKHKTIEEYINQNLQLKTLRIKKFQFHNSFSQQINASRNIKSAMTERNQLENITQRQIQRYKQWQPKLSHRKLMNQPKVLLSVQKRKIKTSQGGRSTAVFSPPKNRLGFKGDKVRHHSFYILQSQERAPKKLVINKSAPKQQKRQIKVPNMHFNYKYIIDQRKKGKDHLSVQQRTKKGSSQGYFACFDSQNFKKYVQKNLYREDSKSRKGSYPRNKISYKRKQLNQINLS